MSGKFWIYLLCLAVPLLITCWVVAPSAMALTGEETRITTNSADQIDPAISGNYIVWTDSRSGNKDIYLYNIPLQTENCLTPGTLNDQYLDDVDGVHVVYTDVTSYGSIIILYDITVSQSTPLTTGGDQYSPAVQGYHAVWVAATSGTYNVWLADISAWTLTKVTTDPIALAVPRVDGDWVVWEEMVGTSWQIRAYQISTGQTRDITSGAANHRRPDVFGDLVVWSDDRNGNWDLYTYSFSSGVTTQLTFSSGNEQYPRISGNRVVWEDSRSGITQIWTTDLDEGFEEPVSSTTHSQILNAIDGNRIVWNEARYGNYDVFMFSIGVKPVADAGADQTVNIGSQVTLDGSLSSDSGGHALTYEWSVMTKPAGSSTTLSDTTAQKPSFTADKIGDYTFQLVVNNGNFDSDPSTVTIHAINQPPVAEAGPDQSIIIVGSIIDLDGTQSYDPAGNSFTYFWEITSKPAGSTTALSDPTSSKPTFKADVQGEYVITLEVTNFYEASSTDKVVVSFNNVKPVADAGINQAVPRGTTVSLDGSGSHDANGDIITYQWNIVTKPVGSGATITTPTSVTTSFVADKAGTYELSLVVNDGLVYSDPSVVTVTATDNPDSVITDVIDAIDAINSLDPQSFKNANMQNALTNKLTTVIQMVEQGQYAEALDKLQNDILQKTDGCALTGASDKNDWIKDCTAQLEIYPKILSIIDQVRGLL
jgi:beta propeller repeat protein